MSHFKVMVIGSNPESQLEPFNENLEIPRYVEYTKEELIAKGKKEIEEYAKGTYAKYLADKKAYKKKCNNKWHLNYLEKEFPLKLKWTDEEIYSDQLVCYDSEDIGADGEVYSDYNPNSKWDWYSLGGRWSGDITLKEGKKGVCGRSGVFNNKVGIDSALKGDIANFEELIPFAVLKDGKWYEKGKMGWWAVVSDEKDNWNDEFLKLVKDLPDDTLISMYDCHI